MRLRFDMNTETKSASVTSGSFYTSGQRSQSKWNVLQWRSALCNGSDEIKLTVQFAEHGHVAGRPSVFWRVSGQREDIERGNRRCFSVLDLQSCYPSLLHEGLTSASLRNVDCSLLSRQYTLNKKKIFSFSALSSSVCIRACLLIHFARYIT
jgi:hypothetical protein